MDLTAFKADAGKPRWDLLMTAPGCANALAGVVQVLTFAVTPPGQGGKGYHPHSWREVPDAIPRYKAALFRHFAAIERGEVLDPESGESHWYHFICTALFLAELHHDGIVQASKHRGKACAEQPAAYSD